MLLASCADEIEQNFMGGEPGNTAYEYLNEYAPLKEYINRAGHPGFKLGVGTAAADYNKKGLVYGLTNSNFDETVAGNEMKMASCVNDKGLMDFSTVKEYVRNAADAGMSVYGHTLVWHSQQSVKWLNSLIADRPIQVEPGEMVENVIHECDYANHSSYPWYSMNNGAEKVEDGCLVIDNPEVGPNIWSMQYFVDDGVPTKTGEDYIIRVTMKATGEGSLNCNVGDWSATSSCSIDFSTEWQTIDAKVLAVPTSSSFVIFQSGSFAGTIWVKKVEVIKMEAAGGAVKYMENLISNGDMEGDDVSCFFSKEPPSSDVLNSVIYDGAGVDGSRGIIVKSGDNPSENWDCQFFIRLPEALPEGTKYHVEFDYRASRDGANTETQAHGEPGAYQHWEMIGSPTFNQGWQHWDKTGTISASQAGGNGMQTIAFNLSNNKVATEFHFDNIKFEVEKEYSNGIPLTDEEKRDTLTWAMERWISGMMEACNGKVKAWEVVNEAVSGGNPDAEGVFALQHANGNTSDFFWQDYLGDVDYVRTAVRLARKYGPEDMKLFVNDYNLEDGGGKLNSLIKWIERWEADGVTKIDGIGSQMHVTYRCNPDEQKANEENVVKMLKALAATGKLIRISELDMGIWDTSAPDDHKIETSNEWEKHLLQTAYVTEEQHKAMAGFYKFIITKYFEIIPKEQQWGITQWAPTDSPAGSGWRPNQPIGLWDVNYYRKHTYAGFTEGLEDGSNGAKSE